MSTPPETVHKREFWADENTKYARPHHRMLKVAHVVTRLAAGENRRLLDVGCGPATLGRLLPRTISYYGIDIAIHEPAPNLTECDILQDPITAKQSPFDFVVAQGLFEYLADSQSQKFAEIADLLAPDGIFVVTYVNFAHREPDRYWLYNNIQSPTQFRNSLAEHFVLERRLPTSHNWSHAEPERPYLRTVNMHVNVIIPLLTKWLGVEYLYVCRPRR